MKRTPMARSAPLRRDTGDARLTVPAPVKRKCKVCKSEFLRVRMGQVVCSPRCAQELAVAKRAKEKAEMDRLERADIRARKEAMKRRRDWEAEAQVEFNRYIRLRDRGLPCICCGRRSAGQSLGGDFDAGHFRSRGAAPHLRFDERNVHAQLKHCNRYAFDASAYRCGLVARIGIEAVEALEADQSPRRYSIEDLKEIKRTYAAKARALEKELP